MVPEAQKGSAKFYGVNFRHLRFRFCGFLVLGLVLVDFAGPKVQRLRGLRLRAIS